jgi:predicted nucleic acid-binding protein
MMPDDLSATAIAGLNQGHRQTTDSYLAMLAQHNGIRLATLEEALAKRFPGATEWVK